MNTNTFEYNGAKITTREQIGRDVLNLRNLLFPKFSMEPYLSDPNVMTFLEAITQSEIEGHLRGFELPQLTATEAELHESYEAFQELPGDLMWRWLGSLRQVKTRNVDPDLAPPDEGNEGNA